MKVFFAGDLFLGGDLLGKDCQDVIASALYKEADLRVANLEQAISDSDYIEDKCTLYTGSDSLKQLKQMRFDIVNLAHNHIQDKGLDGIIETAAALNAENIRNFGAGGNIYEASEPVNLTEDLLLLGYCEFGKPYLNQIEVAGYDKPGVNPLRYKKVLEDLSKLQPGQQAVLYFHWGMEHVWLPPTEDIKLARKLLSDERVAAIIGMHCHRVQGVINYKGKKAYMGIGNFLFPNFYISPPTQIAYPDEQERRNIKYETRQYHAVYGLTYKKWRLVNRVSRVLLYDTCSKKFKSEFVVQDDNQPRVKTADFLLGSIYTLWASLLTAVYRLPLPLYDVVFKVHAKATYFLWRGQIRIFCFRQLGFVKSFEKLKGRLRNQLG